jgi:hypothetical protein
VVGFSILGVSRFRKERPFEAELSAGKRSAAKPAAQFTKQLTEKELRQQALRALTENSGQSKLDAFSPSFLAKPPITKMAS